MIHHITPIRMTIKNKTSTNKNGKTAVGEDVKRKCQSLSHVQLFATPWTAACQALWSMNSPGKNTAFLPEGEG